MYVHVCAQHRIIWDLRIGCAVRNARLRTNRRNHVSIERSGERKIHQEELRSGHSTDGNRATSYENFKVQTAKVR